MYDLYALDGTSAHANQEMSMRNLLKTIAYARAYGASWQTVARIVFS